MSLFDCYPSYIHHEELNSCARSYIGKELTYSSESIKVISISIWIKKHLTWASEEQLAVMIQSFSAHRETHHKNQLATESTCRQLLQPLPRRRGPNSRASQHPASPLIALMSTPRRNLLRNRWVFRHAIGTSFSAENRAWQGCLFVDRSGIDLSPVRLLAGGTLGNWLMPSTMIRVRIAVQIWRARQESCPAILPSGGESNELSDYLPVPSWSWWGLIAFFRCNFWHRQTRQSATTDFPQVFAHKISFFFPIQLPIKLTPTSSPCRSNHVSFAVPTTALLLPMPILPFRSRKSRASFKNAKRRRRRLKRPKHEHHRSMRRNKYSRMNQSFAVLQV